MSKQASPTLIGAFVVGAIALVVVGLLVFGSGRFFADRLTWVSYFPGSVKGLRVGAPVNFRGVRIGEVTRIEVLYDEQDGSMLIPVVMEVVAGQVTVIDRGDGPRRERTDVEDLIARGLRAQLQTDSLVTGLLSVDLDFYPDVPVEQVRIDSPALRDYPVVPAIPSRMEELEQSLGTVMQEIPGLLRDLRGLLGEVTSGQTASNVDRILQDVAQFTDSLDRATPAIGADGRADRAERRLDPAGRRNRRADHDQQPGDDRRHHRRSPGHGGRRSGGWPIRSTTWWRRTGRACATSPRRGCTRLPGWRRTRSAWSTRSPV